jgi:hypothetical protein
MLRKYLKYSFLLLLTLVSIRSFSQTKNEYKQPRILILLDGSSSMLNEWTSGKNRFKAAGNIILTLMDSIYNVNDQVEFGLRVYGHEHPVPENNCFDTKKEVIFTKSNMTQMSLRLESLHPMGVSPIAYSLKVAAENDFVDERDYAYSLVLVTDGGESCGGNICDIVKTLLDKKINFKPYIVSLVDYAPLKDQYDCLGTYLTVSKPSEMVPAIRTITEAYRKVLAIPIIKPKPIETKTIPSPSVQRIKVEPVKLPPREAETTAVVKVPQPEVVKPEVPKPKNMTVDTAPYPKENIKSINRLGFDRINYSLYWSLPKASSLARKVPALTLPPVEAEILKPVAVQPKPSPPKPSPSKPTEIKKITPAANEKKEAAYSINLEPAAETLLEIYFTDGKGKYYHSTPPLQLLDAKTGKEVKRFYRTTDASGNPDPQKVPTGNYTLMIGKTGNYLSKNVTIHPSQKNKMVIVVSNGSLAFRYDDNLKRPVNEFIAIVRRNFEPGPTITQKCTSKLEYEPGNYHVEINTLPISRRTIDLDFGYEMTIDIPEPGFVQFTDSEPKGKVTLYYPLGDQFMKFYAMDVNGNKDMQKLRLQPGIYEVHWKKNPRLPMEPDVVRTFYVKSNETTEVLLN